MNPNESVYMHAEAGAKRLASGRVAAFCAAVGGVCFGCAVVVDAASEPRRAGANYIQPTRVTGGVGVICKPERYTHPLFQGCGLTSDTGANTRPVSRAGEATLAAVNRRGGPLC